jgi:hypothetical protein
MADARQRGAIIAGVWLIGLGLVFLIQQALDVPWGRAWPLFLVLGGVGSAASAIVGGALRRGAWGLVWTLVWPLLFVTVGVLLFLDFAGLAEIDAVALFLAWWPVALIVVGALVLISAVWPGDGGAVETLNIASTGLDAGEVSLKFGAGTLEVGPGVPGTLVSGTFGGGVKRRDLAPGRVELAADVAAVIPWFGQTLTWQVELDPELPMRLRLDGGAARNVLELGELRVTSLHVETGASDTLITLPRRVERCEVHVEAGAAQVTIRLPAGVAARIRSDMALGSTNVDERRFPRASEGWASPDVATAAHLAEIRIEGGIGSVRIE